MGITEEAHEEESSVKTLIEELFSPERVVTN